MSSYNIYGGTPKKTLDLMKYSNHESFLYIYHDSYPEFKYLFEKATPHIVEGFYGRNLYKHVKKLLEIINQNDIQIIQTQFTFGEIVGGILKVLRPNVKVISAFVVPFTPGYFKSLLLPFIYNKMDAFVYVSQYVKVEKEKNFPILKKQKTKIIFNGTEKRWSTDDDFPSMKHPSLYSTSGLAEWKNIDVLVEAINILKEKGTKQVNLYVAGDGPERKSIEDKINQYGLEQQVFLLGYQKNIGALLDQADIYVHPAYAEGFGIAVAEAMLARKPMIVADAGALPELIENDKSGLVVDPFDANAWAEAILKFIEDKKMANEFAENAGIRAQNEFSIDKYVSNYNDLYISLMY